MRFEDLTRLSGLRRPSTDEDYDTLHCLQTDGEGRYYIEGEFGEVWIESAMPVLIFEDEAGPVEVRLGKIVDGSSL